MKPESDSDHLESCMKGEDWLTLLSCVTVSERGAITVPVRLRKLLDIRPGQRLLVFTSGNQHALNLTSLEGARRILSDNSAEVQR